MRTAAQRSDAPRSAGFQIALARSLAMRGHVADAWKAGLATKSQAASDIVVLGLVNADTAAAAMRSWLRERSDASLYALPSLAMARDTASLRRTMTLADSVIANMPPQMPRMQRVGLSYVAQSARSYYALARGDTAAATREFDRLSDSIIYVPTDQFVRARLVARADPRRGYQLMTQKKLTGDLISVARELEIGRLAEKLGDARRAVDAYAYVASAWQHTDSEQLRGAVAESRNALARLDSDGRVRAQLANVR
jgi:hypothetical protein